MERENIEDDIQSVMVLMRELKSIFGGSEISMVGYERDEGAPLACCFSCKLRAPNVVRRVTDYLLDTQGPFHYYHKSGGMGVSTFGTEVWSENGTHIFDRHCDI